MPLGLTDNCFFHGSLSPAMPCTFVFVFCCCCTNIIHLLPHSLRPTCPGGSAARRAQGWAERTSRPQPGWPLRGSCSPDIRASGRVSPRGCRTDGPASLLAAGEGPPLCCREHRPSRPRGPSASDPAKQPGGLLTLELFLAFSSPTSWRKFSASGAPVTR